jgi:Ca-activated chloride channel family protein
MLLVGILIGFLIFSAISFLFPKGGPSGNGQNGIPPNIQFTFLYTSEKQSWIEEVTPDFEQWFHARFNITVHVRLLPSGSYDTVNTVLWESEQPTAWSPASSIWIPYLNQKWKSLGHNEEVAKDSTPLVLSPIVIAGWSSFLQQHNITDFRDLYQLAIDGIDYKYGHPDPLLSNGGVMAVVLEFSEAFGKKPNQFEANDFNNQTALDFVRSIESKAVRYGKSTGFFGRWAAENGPLAIDCFTVYESVVIDNSQKAKNKWGDSLTSVYPERGTLLSDHPYVILDAPWVDNWQRFAATQFLFYLLQEQTQDKAQIYGFRPANPSVPLNENIFNEQNGVEYEIQVPIFKPLSGEAMETLLTVWPSVRNPGV